MAFHRQVGKVIEERINLISPDFKKHSYEIYKESRKSNPVLCIYKGELGTEWLITRYADAKSLLKDSRLKKNPTNIFSKEKGPTLFSGGNVEALTPFMFQTDDPDHTRLRSSVQRQFSFNRVLQLEEKIQKIADDLLDEIKSRGTLNLIEDYARPLPIYVIGEMLGVPQQDRENFREWADLILSSQSSNVVNLDKEEKLSEFMMYLHTLIESKKVEPGRDLISHLVSNENKDKILNARELYSMITLIMLAGYKPTVHLITNTVLALLENPNQFDKLKKNPDLIDSTIEEGLRYYPAAETTTARWVVEPFELHGQKLEIGDLITISIASANRDETVFENPDEFDITRENNKHIAFGIGSHACLGPILARLEGKIGVATLVNRIPTIKINGNREDIKWEPSYALRYLKELPLTF